MILMKWIIKRGPQFNKAQFARDLKVDKASLYHYMNQERTPSLPTALNIVHLTGGEVTLQELVRPSELSKLLTVENQADSENNTLGDLL